MNKKNTIRSPFFYVGDKYKLMPQLKSLFPDDIDNYIEPFVGRRELISEFNRK